MSSPIPCTLHLTSYILYPMLHVSSSTPYTPRSTWYLLRHVPLKRHVHDAIEAVHLGRALPQVGRQLERGNAPTIVTHQNDRVLRGQDVGFMV